MNILVIYGSPRKGNTWGLVKRIQEYLSIKQDVNFSEIYLSSLNIPTCLGCYNCFLNGEDRCPYKDYIQPIVDKIMKADGIIITTPVYALNVSGLIKNFFDHTAYLYHRPRFFNKKALVIVTTVGGGARSTAKYVRDTLQYWGFNKIYSFYVNCYALDYVPSEKVTKGLNKLAEKFYKDLKSKRFYSPNLKWLIIYNVWRALAVSSDGENSADRIYWKETDLAKYLILLICNHFSPPFNYENLSFSLNKISQYY